MSSKNLFFIAILVLCFLSFELKAQTTQKEDIPTLTYSELIQNKDLYVGKTVRVKAFHIYGFEWSFLCDSGCKERRSETWVEFEDELCKGSKRKLKKGSDNFDNKAEVIYVGKLSNGNFGHFGAYEFQFTVSCVESYKKLKVELE